MQSFLGKKGLFWEYCFLRRLLLLCKCYFYLVKTRSSTFTEVVVGIWRKKILPRIFYPFLEVYGRCLESMCCSIRVISIYSLYPHFAMLLYSKKQNKNKTKKLVVFMRIISTSSTSSTPYRWWGCSEGPHCIVPFPYLLVGWIFFFWLFSFISLDTEGGRQLFFLTWKSGADFKLRVKVEFCCNKMSVFPDELIYVPLFFN